MSKFKVIKVKRSGKPKAEYISGFSYGKPNFTDKKQDAKKFHKKEIPSGYPRYSTNPNPIVSFVAKNFGSNIGLGSTVSSLKKDYKTYKVSIEDGE